MGRFAKKMQTMRAVLITAGVAAALVYGLVFRALSREAEDLDAKLEQSWSNLNRESSVDVNGRLEAAHRSVAALVDVELSVSNRIRIDAALEKNLKAPFQLVEFEIERATRSDQLLQLAAAKKLKIPQAPFEELPDYTEEIAEPHLLWGRLAIAYHALITAIDAGVDSVDSVGSFKIRRHGADETYLDEITFEMTLTGPMSKVAVFLKALSMDRENLERHGLTTTQATKPALFVDGLMLRKRPGQKLDDVRLDIRIGGFIYRQEGMKNPLSGKAGK
jgi:hypothetical protein